LIKAEDIQLLNQFNRIAVKILILTLLPTKTETELNYGATLYLKGAKPPKPPELESLTDLLYQSLTTHPTSHRYTIYVAQVLFSCKNSKVALNQTSCIPRP
jgi:hypothetical protein